VLVGAEEVLVGGEDWINVGRGVSGGAVVVVLLVDVEVPGSSVSVSVSVSVVAVDVVALVVDGGRTVVKVSGGSLEVRCRTVVLVAGAGDGLLLVLGEVPGQSSPTKFPFSACPNNDNSEASAPSQTDSRVDSTLFRPFTHVVEHVLPATKSFIEQPGISAS